MTTEPSEIDPETLIAEAAKARQYAYAPYSRYAVGAALLTAEGHIVGGCNVENAVYPLTQCAERVALAKAVSEGATGILAIAVITQNGGTPCGACRQVLREFAAPDTPVFIARTDGAYRETTLGDLLPDSFTAQDLPEP